jgi:hypothetical protein
MKLPAGAALAVLAGLTATAPAAAADGGTVFVNGAPLGAETITALEQAYRVPIDSGRYWYDRVSGAWGFEGGPAQGQIAPGLALGGPLRANASAGTTGVFVNGRELHVLDVLALQRCTPVYRGRYWLNASGIGGYEGGPPLFNLVQLCAARGGNVGSSTQTECYSNGCQSTNSRTGIGAITDGQGHGAVFVPGGGMIMTPN